MIRPALLTRHDEGRDVNHKEMNCEQLKIRRMRRFCCRLSADIDVGFDSRDLHTNVFYFEIHSIMVSDLVSIRELICGARAALNT